MVAGLRGRSAGGCMRRAFVVGLALVMVPVLATPVTAAVITFDELVAGATSFGYDGDGDGVNDVVFSTTDPLGFNTVGPGPNMSYINEPGIEGTSLLSPDLRVDFLVGALNAVSFGFAVNTGAPLTNAVTFSLFDAADNLLASVTADADFTLPNGVDPSSFPEALVPLAFAGTAAYGTFDFDTTANRYIIDNFEGTFGTTEVPTIPEPSTLLLLGAGLARVFVRRRRPLALERTLAAQNRQW